MTAITVTLQSSDWNGSSVALRWNNSSSRGLGWQDMPATAWANEVGVPTEVRIFPTGASAAGDITLKTTKPLDDDGFAALTPITIEIDGVSITLQSLMRRGGTGNETIWRPGNRSELAAFAAPFATSTPTRSAQITFLATPPPPDPPPDPPPAGSDAYRRAVRALYPVTHVYQCVRISVGTVVTGLVRGYESVTIGARTYQPAAFRVRIDVASERRGPTAALEIDHVGRALIDWIDAAGGGIGADIEILEFAADSTTPDWSLSFKVTGLSVTTRSVSIRLGFVPLLGQPSVQVRYDPETAPGLF